MNGLERPGLPGRFRDRRRAIGLSYIFKGQAIIWRCPFCGHGWPRFDSGPMHERAVAHLDSDEQKRWEEPVNGGR